MIELDNIFQALNKNDDIECIEDFYEDIFNTLNERHLLFLKEFKNNKDFKKNNLFYENIFQCDHSEYPSVDLQEHAAKFPLFTLEESMKISASFLRKEINEDLKKILLEKIKEEFFPINTKEISRLKEEFLLYIEKEFKIFFNSLKYSFSHTFKLLKKEASELKKIIDNFSNNIDNLDNLKTKDHFIQKSILKIEAMLQLFYKYYNKKKIMLRYIATEIYARDHFNLIVIKSFLNEFDHFINESIDRLKEDGEKNLKEVIEKTFNDLKLANTLKEKIKKLKIFYEDKEHQKWCAVSNISNILNHLNQNIIDCEEIIDKAEKFIEEFYLEKSS